MHVRSASLAGLVVVSLGCASAASGGTVAFFDGGRTDSGALLQTFNSASGISIQDAGGNPGGFLRLTDSNNQHNYATFDRSDAGTFPTSTFSFQFRLDVPDGSGGDGFSFAYYPTGIFGAAGGFGVAPFAEAEEPAQVGVLAFAFDTWSNGPPLDVGAPSDPNYHEMSIFYGGQRVALIADTRVRSTPLALDDGNWHTVTGSVNFTAQTTSLSVDGNPFFANVSVPGLGPFESRVGFGARTAGASEHADIDNVNVQFVVPEPSAAGLATLALAVLAARRRRPMQRGHF